MILQTLLLVLPVTCLSSFVTINVNEALSEVEPFYLSYAIDAYLLGETPKWLNFDFKQVLCFAKKHAFNNICQYNS